MSRCMKGFYLPRSGSGRQSNKVTPPGGVSTTAPIHAAIRYADGKGWTLRKRGNQRNATLTSQTQPMYRVNERAMAGQKPRRGTMKIMAMT
jgi:hypothetical protein